MFQKANLTYAIFDVDKLPDARAVAQRLRATNHQVAVHVGEEFESASIPVGRIPIQRAIASSTMIVAGLLFGSLALVDLWTTGAMFTGFATQHAVFAFALVLFFSGLFGLTSRALAVTPELRRAESELAEPGRMALTVSSARGRRAFIEAELAKAGALTVGSV